ncbi:hypothetical protein Tco_0344699 [Tanacetum coccineum]
MSNELKNVIMQKPSGSGSLPCNTVANPRGDVKAITTRSGVAYDGPMILPTPSPLPKEVEYETRRTIRTKLAPKPNPKPSIPYPSRLNDQKLCEKANSQMLKFLQIFQRLHFDISFADALLHMPKFASTFKSLLTVLLKKLPEKLGDPDKFLIPCDFPELDECLALADLGASINLMPLSDMVESFRYGTPSDSHDTRTCKLIGCLSESLNVIDVACEEYAQEVLRFSDSSTSGNPTPSDPIIATSFPSFTPFEGGYFILEEIGTFLRTPEELSNLDDDYYNTEGDILYLEKLLNEDPSPTISLR